MTDNYFDMADYMNGSEGIHMEQEKIKGIIEIINSKNGISEIKKQIGKFSENWENGEKMIALSIEEAFSTYSLPFSYDEEIKIYYFDKLEDKDIPSVIEIWEESRQNYFTAVMGEVLGNRLKDKKYTIKALIAYYNEFVGNGQIDGEMFVCLACSVCRIYRKNRIPEFEIYKFENLCVEFIEKHKDDTNYLVLFLLKGLVGIGYKKIKTLYLELIEHFRKHKNYTRAIAFEEDFENYVAKNAEEKRNIIIKLAEDYERSADQYNWDDPNDAHNIIFQIHNAMNAWKKINDEKSKTERKRLAKRIAEVKRKQLENMQIIKGGKIDFKEFDEALDHFLQSALFEEFIAQFVNIFKLDNIETIKKRMENTTFYNLFPLSILDAKGRTIAIIPPISGEDKEKNKERYVYEAKKNYELSTDIKVNRFLAKAKEKFQFTEETLSFILESNCFIPEDRKKSVLKGLAAGFNYDFITAMHLLMPQVENAIRVLAEECGAVVYKTNEDGTEESLSLESILNLSEVKDVLEEDFLFNLKVFYTSKVGFGMRNRVAHGVYSDDELRSIDGLAVWWFTLKLCCEYSGSLRKRLMEIKEKRGCE